MEVARERVIAARPFCDTIASVQEEGCVCLRSGGCCDWAAILPRLHRVHGFQFLVFESHGGLYKAFSRAPLQQQLLAKQSVASVADYTFLFVATLSADFCAGVKAAAARAPLRRLPAGPARAAVAARVSSCLACIRHRFGPGSADRAAKRPKLEKPRTKAEAFSFAAWKK